MTHTTPRLSAHHDAHGNITAYANDDTDPAVMMALHKARQGHDRIRIWYGDTEGGYAWPEEYDVTGYVGRSTGQSPVFILVHNTRSTGGPAILTSCIVRIDCTADGHTLYKHPDFTAGLWTYALEGSGPDVRWAVYHNGDLHARFKRVSQATHYIDFMTGRRYRK